MSYLLDTCVISETRAPEPEASVLDWFLNTPDTKLFVSVATFGEILRGIYQLENGKRRARLEAWYLDELVPSFAGRVLPIDEHVMTNWARMSAKLKAIGRPRPIVDSLIEATALSHGLILVTRNENDFIDSEVSILNPWNLSE